jgi:hypothetical protein
MSDKTPQQGGPQDAPQDAPQSAQGAESRPQRSDELTEETLESVSGGVIDGPGGCISPCKPTYPDWPRPTDPTF